MPKHGGHGKGSKPFPRPEWMTEDGLLDVARYPIGGLLSQALDRKGHGLRSACVLLESMCAAGRTEAGVYLLGLLRMYQDDLERASAVVTSLGTFRVPQCADALVGELRRVKGSNATRKYLGLVLGSLLRFPPDIVEKHLAALAEDKSLSIRMRQKFKAALQDLWLRGPRRDALFSLDEDDPWPGE